MAGVPSADEALPQWPEAGSARVVPLQETGAPGERLNLIVICDGYQADQILAGNSFAGRLSCSGSSAPVRDLGAANELRGVATGECSAL